MNKNNEIKKEKGSVVNTLFQFDYHEHINIISTHIGRLMVSEVMIKARVRKGSPREMCIRAG